MRFYLDTSDFLKFVTKAVKRRRSIEDYYKFQEFQGNLLNKYLNFNNIDISDYLILDLANGFGGETAALKKRCKTILGLDLNFPPNKIDLNQIVADAVKTPFQDSTFDMIICASLIEHLKDPKILLDELARISKPGGYVYLSFPPFYSFWGGHSYAPFHYFGEKRAVKFSKFTNRLFKRKIFNSDIYIGNSFEKAYDNWGLYPLTIKKAKNELKNSNLIIVDQSTKWMPINFSKFNLLNEFLTWHVQFLLVKNS